jgi:hypothetical protein
MGVLTILVLAATAGIVYPYINGWKRKHFALASFLLVIGSTIAWPYVDPEGYAQSQREKAAQQKADEAEEAQLAKAEAEAPKKAKVPAEDTYGKVLAKGLEAAEERLPYIRSEYPKLYAKVGSATFAKLGTLEEGAIYHAAESENCEKVSSAGVSDVSRPGMPVFFVDCVNETRFIVLQDDAAAALKRFKDKKLAVNDLSESCTWRTVSQCKPDAANPLPIARETDIVSACDDALVAALPKSDRVEMLGNGKRDYTQPGQLRISRLFVSDDANGDLVKGTYQCSVSLAGDKVVKLTAEGGFGRKTII